MSEKITAPKVLGMKGQRKVVCLTAYDVTFARLADEAGVDLILVGDSLGNVMLGHDTTLPVTIEDMAHHTKAVRRGVTRALLVADLPFGSYQESTAQAVRSSVALMRAGAEAVKLEGDYPEAVEALVKAGIPVMGHVGFTPQSVNRFGGFKVQGRGEGGADVESVAQRLDSAGVFATVLELIPAALASTISGSVANPTIGIGAGAGCDGQIQVLHDVLGLSQGAFKHAKRYLDGATLIAEALKHYAADVRSASFPGPENSF